MSVTVPKHALLVNPRSGKGKTHAEISALHEFCMAQLGEVSLFAPSHTSGMKQIAESLSDAGCKSFLVAGGDGTVNLIADRLIAAKNTKTSICLLNSGHDSDLARTVWNGLEDQERLACLAEEHTQLIDTLAIDDSFGNTFTALNSCSVGASALMIKKQSEFPQTWPNWTRSTIPTVRTIFKPQIFHTQKDGDAVAIVCSNGKFSVGGLKFAPEARLNDGKFDVTTIRPGSLFNYLKTLPRLYSHGLTQTKLIEKTICDKISIVCKNNVLWEHDGECGETRSLSIQCRPNSLRLVVPRG